uniref:Uncharacterized protein n=1 Tax=Arundo donax TaxID=35708 RepID=A0A0A9H0N5_ARUDO
MRFHRPSLVYSALASAPDSTPAVGVAVPRETPPTAVGVPAPSSSATASLSVVGVAVTQVTPPAAVVDPVISSSTAASPSPTTTTSSTPAAGVAVTQVTPPAAMVDPVISSSTTATTSSTPAAGVVVPQATPPAARAARALSPSSTAVMPMPSGSLNPAALNSSSAAAVGMAVPSETPPMAVVTPRTSARDAFIAKLVRHTANLLPVPTINKRRVKTMPPRQTPRRSRRLTGAQVEFKPDDLERRSKKQAMRSLQIIEEQDGIDQQAQDDYSKLFGHPLSDLHLQALAALFKWSIPEDLDHDSGDTVAA